MAHQRGAAGHDFCGSLDDGGADGALGLFAEPVKPAVALLKDIGEALSAGVPVIRIMHGSTVGAVPGSGLQV